MRKILSVLSTIAACVAINAAQAGAPSAPGDIEKTCEQLLEDGKTTGEAVARAAEEAIVNPSKDKQLECDQFKFQREYYRLADTISKKCGVDIVPPHVVQNTGNLLDLMLADCPKP